MEVARLLPRSAGGTYPPSQCLDDEHIEASIVAGLERPALISDLARKLAGLKICRRNRAL
jgi:hypothetical protein